MVPLVTAEYAEYADDSALRRDAHWRQPEEPLVKYSQVIRSIFVKIKSHQQGAMVPNQSAEAIAAAPDSKIV